MSRDPQVQDNLSMDANALKAIVLFVPFLQYIFSKLNLFVAVLGKTQNYALQNVIGPTWCKQDMGKERSGYSKKRTEYADIEYNFIWKRPLVQNIR